MSEARMQQQIEQLIRQLDHLLDKADRLFPTPREESDLDWSNVAFRWQRQADGRDGRELVAVKRPHRVALDDLLCIEEQKAELLRNSRQFVRGQPANNALLWGSRGNGKSTLVKAVFNALASEGLRLIELQKEELAELSRLADLLYDRPERFILYCDDLSFDANDPAYKPLKAALEGSIAAPPENLLIYATSNRRHLLPEFQAENQQARVIDEELHLGDALEEKISLSERFGLRLPFRPFSQNDYLQVVDHWLAKQGLGSTADETTRLAAIRWATQHGGRSGRTAYQFVIDWLGRRL
ncbi:MAG: ATP-binding protein [Gammaproteobacteria bacterium]|nr:ATP-binding protein [Gammaproteobacteria bacterium]